MASKTSNTVEGITSVAQNEILAIGQAAVADATAAQSEMTAISERVTAGVLAARAANVGLKALGHAGLDLSGLPRVPRSASAGATARTPRASSGTRPKNDMDLKLSILGVLSVVGVEPMGPSEIAELVVVGGYNTTSKTFNVQTSQALSVLVEEKLVRCPSRAAYSITAKGSKHFAASTENA